MRSSRLSSVIKRSTFTSAPLHRTPLTNQTRRCLHPQQRHLSSTSTSRSDTTPSSTAPPNTPSRESIHPETHYDLFPTLGASSIPPSGPFTLDASALKKDFLSLQSRFHPDRLPASQKKQAEAASARINDAYKTLLNPLLRAQYLLSLRGIDVAGDETAKVEDPELLMEVLETREVIEEAETEEELVGLREGNEKRVEGSVGVLEDAFARDDLEAAREEAVKLRYWINIRESIDGWEKGKPVVLEH